MGSQAFIGGDMANQDENQTTGTKAKYRVVAMPVAASPCRNCPVTHCYNRLRCPHLISVRNDLLSEMSGYGVADNNF
jgi:hypothetical protein